MPPKLAGEQARVLLVGYSPHLRGGIPAVTGTLLEHMPNVVLFEALKFYRPLYRQVLYTLGAYVRFAATVVFKRPQVVHVLIGGRFDLARNAFYILLSRLFWIPVLVAFHTNKDAVFSGFTLRLKWLFTGVLNAANEICYLSPLLMAEMVDFTGIADKGVVIPNPIPLGHIGTSPLPLTGRSRHLVFLGRWTDLKGSAELEIAMQSLWDEDRLTCVCYGDCNPSRSVPGCRFMGWVDGDAKLQAIRKARALVLPSHAEAYPSVLIEAAAEI